MALAMITKEQFLKFAPSADARYVNAFLAGESSLRDAGILDDVLELTHFMAQCGAETDYFRIVRENLNYTTVGAIRGAWKARASKHSDEWIKLHLIRNPVALGDWAYGGREGNRKGTKDGFNFRGGGPLQATHCNNVTAYCKGLGIAVRDDILDDVAVTFRFACYEWKTSGCGKYARENDILAVSKIINTGSAKSRVMPNGLGHRKAAFEKAWGIWGDQRDSLPETTDITIETLRDAGSETIKTGDWIKAGSAVGGAVSAITGAASSSGIVETVPSAPVAEPLDQIRNLTESADAMPDFVAAFKGLMALAVSNIWVLGLVCGVCGYFLAQHINNRRLSDARLGLNTSRIGN